MYGCVEAELLLEFVSFILSLYDTEACRVRLDIHGLSRSQWSFTLPRSMSSRVFVYVSLNSSGSASELYPPMFPPKDAVRLRGCPMWSLKVLV